MQLLDPQYQGFQRCPGRHGDLETTLSFRVHREVMGIDVPFVECEALLPHRSEVSRVLFVVEVVTESGTDRGCSRSEKPHYQPEHPYRAQELNEADENFSLVAYVKSHGPTMTKVLQIPSQNSN